MQVTQELLDSILAGIREADKNADLDAKAVHEDNLREAVSSLEHTYLGPSFRETEAGDWDLPEHTLGWEILGWCADYLNHFEGDPDNPTPLNLTDEQARLILWWYAIDENGKFVYRKGVLQRLKGWGKDPLLSVICAVEFVGPCRFSHWDENGEPVATNEPRSLVQVAAVNQEQTNNTSDMFAVIFSKKLIAQYGIKLGQEIIRASSGRQQIKMVTSSYRSLEGSRTTFCVLNETHHWVKGNNGHKMYETVDGNVTKSGGRGSRYLAITNAFLPGEDSVAERARNAYESILEGRAIDVGFMYDSIEAHTLTPMHPIALEMVVPIIRGDSFWLTVVDIMASIQDESIPVSRSRRMWLNQIFAGEESMWAPWQWDALEGEATLEPGDELVLGFDGARTRDSTALVGISLSTNTVFLLGLWEKPDGPEGENWVVNHAAVNGRIHEMFNKYTVIGFYADVKEWESHTIDWHEAFGERLMIKASEQKSAVEWDMRNAVRSLRAHERLASAIENAEINWSPATDPERARALRRHVLNVHREETSLFGGGVYFRKETPDSSRKIDAYAAMMLAHEALNDYRTRGRTPEKRPARVWVF